MSVGDSESLCSTQGEAFIHEKDTDYPSGTLLGAYYDMSPSACREACLRDCQCVGFVTNVDFNQGQCFLKGDLPAAGRVTNIPALQTYRRTTGCSGDGTTTFVLEDNVDFQGFDLTVGGPIQSRTPAQCEALCAMDCQCVGFVMNSKTLGLCYPKFKFSKRRVKMGVFSWTWTSGGCEPNPRVVVWPQVAAIALFQTVEGTIVVVDRSYGEQIWDSPANDKDPRPRLPWGERARSMEINPLTGKLRPLSIGADPFCTTGQPYPNGTFAVLGGNGEGARSVRTLAPCADGSCDFTQPGELFANHWYAASQILPNGQIIVVGGSMYGASRNSAEINSPVVEYWPRGPRDTKAFPLQFLVDTLRDNMYPHVHLLPSGNLLIVANKKAIKYSWMTDTVVATLPDIPGGPRNYPFTGASVLLPLLPANGYRAEVLLCGGGNPVNDDLNNRSPAQSSCGRICPDCPNPAWEMDRMPGGARLMPQLMLLPDTRVVLFGGAGVGYGAGGQDAVTDPKLQPEMYAPGAALGSRFLIRGAPTFIPRVYHSCSTLLPDGRVFMHASHPATDYYATTGPFTTDFRGETWCPPYKTSSLPRAVLHPTGDLSVFHNVNFNLTGKVQPGVTATMLSFLIINPGFSTHSMLMGHRLVVLDKVSITIAASGDLLATLRAPPNTRVCPPGFYLLFLVQDGVPCKRALSVRIGSPTITFR